MKNVLEIALAVAAIMFGLSVGNAILVRFVATPSNTVQN